MVISVAEAFSPFPAGRYSSDGPFNGERFREEILRPALREGERSGDRVVVLLDGAMAYSSSFLEEVFGGLVRAERSSPEEYGRKLEVRANDVAYAAAKRDALRYMNEEFTRNPR